MTTMNAALAAIAKGETLTTAEVRDRIFASPSDTGTGAHTPGIATTPRRERLVSLG